MTKIWKVSPGYNGEFWETFNQLWSFFRNMNIGDIIVAYSEKPIWGIGKVISEYYFKNDSRYWQDGFGTKFPYSLQSKNENTQTRFFARFHFQYLTVGTDFSFYQCSILM